VMSCSVVKGQSLGSCSSSSSSSSSRIGGKLQLTMGTAVMGTAYTRCTVIITVSGASYSCKDTEQQGQQHIDVRVGSPGWVEHVE
jgi:hypothetical protein